MDKTISQAAIAAGQQLVAGPTANAQIPAATSGLAKIAWLDRTGRRHIIVTAASPSDWRAVRNAAAMVRKQARAGL